MFGLPGSQNGVRLRPKRKARRKSDSESADAEVTVLRALHVTARRSSPHKAAVRAGIARAISVIEASTLGLCHIKELIDECQALCRSGLTTDNLNKRALLADRYTEALAELDAIAQATGHGGFHLINDSSCTCEVSLGDPDNLTLKLPHINLTTGPRGLALPKAGQAFTSTQALEGLDNHLMLVQRRIEKAAVIFREHGADLATRLALVLEYAIPEGHELDDVPQATDEPLVCWARED